MVNKKKRNPRTIIIGQIRFFCCMGILGGLDFKMMTQNCTNASGPSHSLFSIRNLTAQVPNFQIRLLKPSRYGMQHTSVDGYIAAGECEPAGKDGCRQDSYQVCADGLRNEDGC